MQLQMQTQTKESKTMEYTNLMDLVQQDTSEIKAITSRLQAEGIYVIDWVEASIKSPKEDGEEWGPDEKPRANLRFEGVIVDYTPLVEDSMTEEQIQAMPGKSFNQFETLWLDNVAESIGEIKGKLYARARYATNGALGGMEGVPAGWLNGIEGTRCVVRVRHATNRNGDRRAYFDWLSPKEMAKVDIDWEDLGRAALDADGTEQDESKLMK